MVQRRSKSAMLHGLWLVLIATLPLGGFAVVSLSWLLMQDERAISQDVRYDTTWKATEAREAALRLQLAVAERAMPGGGTDSDQVRPRFDTLTRDIAALRDVYGQRSLAEPAQPLRTLDAIEAALPAVGALLPDLNQAGAAAHVLDLLTPLDGRVDALAGQAKRFQADAATELERRLAVDHRRLGVLRAALLLHGLLIVGLLYRRNRLLSRAHLEVRVLADTLQRNSRELALAHDAVQMANAELSVRHEHFHAALENMSQGLCMVDASERLIVCNRRFAEMFGLLNGTPGTPMADLGGGPADEPDLSRQFIRALKADHLLLEHATQATAFVHERADGRALAVSHQPLPHGGWVATYEDVTERRRVESRIAHMAHHDALTGLPNRTSYRQRIGEILTSPREGEQPVTVLLLDLDHFKEINDTLGHGVGDALLQDVAARLRVCTRDTDLVARLGGDEFAIILCPSTTADDAARLADRIVQAIGEPYLIGGERLLVGVSVGIALQPEVGATADTMLKFADMALYQAKADGRRTWCFYDPAMDAKVQTRRAMSADLCDAIALGQLDVHYQPLIDLPSGAVAGFEALLRWSHPRWGSVPPSDFIPLLEESGLIGVIGDWTLRQACAEAARWPEGIRLAVNLSARQFRGSDIARSVERVLNETGLAPGRLELEITESLLLQDGDDVLGALHALRGLGVGVALDDFGTGYSSLSYLRKFPFSKLKIDRSFVRGMQEQDDCRIIIQAIAAMAYRLGMTVTAEGIETEDQLAIVQEAGCRQGQGFLFGRPAPAASARRLIETRASVGRALQPTV